MGPSFFILYLMAALFLEALRCRSRFASGLHSLPLMKTGFPEIELAVSGLRVRHHVCELDRVLTCVASGAEFITFSAYGSEQARQAEIRKRIRFDVLTD